MKILSPIEKAYIERNANILREFAEMKDKGKVLDEIYPALSKRLEVSTGLIHSVVYHPTYAFCQEAKEQIKEELEEMEKQGKDISQALAKIVGYNLTLSKRVPKPQTT